MFPADHEKPFDPKCLLGYDEDLALHIISMAGLKSRLFSQNMWFKAYFRDPLRVDILIKDGVVIDAERG